MDGHRGLRYLEVRSLYRGSNIFVIMTSCSTALTSSSICSLFKTMERLDCKKVRIFAYSSKREQSSKRSGTRMKTESETGERLFFSRLTRFARVRQKVSKSSQGRKMLLFFTTNMAAVTSRGNQSRITFL